MWPDRFTSAACLSFDFDAEEVWIGEDPRNADKPGVLSQGTYGAKVAVPELLILLERQELRATFFVPGRVAERYPARVEQIVAAGHELAYHGYTHTSPTLLTPEQEEAELVKGLDVLKSFGAPIMGSRSPSWELTPVTLGLLEKHGLKYSSNLMDDIRPYRHDNSAIVELPVQWILDDAPHFWFDGANWAKKIATTSEVRSIWEEEFVGIHKMSGLFMLAMHPQIIGRPSRLAFLDSFISFMKSHDDVWIATGAEIAAQL
jgi:peptidoglycan/xylan/chitin deacetylase (PgdA/CDA1 family)